MLKRGPAVRYWQNLQVCGDARKTYSVGLEDGVMVRDVSPGEPLSDPRHKQASHELFPSARSADEATRGSSFAS